MVNDPIGDMIAQIKNAALAGKKTVTLPYSRMKFSVASIMMQEGYLDEVRKNEDGIRSTLTIRLRYNGRNAVITDLKRKSKPGLRLYVGSSKIPYVIGGMGTAILSTSKGIMTGKEAKKQGLGGELLCELW